MKEKITPQKFNDMQRLRYLKSQLVAIEIEMYKFGVIDEEEVKELERVQKEVEYLNKKYHFIDTITSN